MYQADRFIKALDSNHLQPDDGSYKRSEEKKARKRNRLVENEDSEQDSPHGPYARPHGISRPDRQRMHCLARSPMLKNVQIRKPAPQSQYSMPEAPFIFPRQKVKPVSNSPATIKIIQFINNLRILKSSFQSPEA